MDANPPYLAILNPNASDTVTEAIARAAAPFARLGVEIESITSPDGPFGIESDEDVAASVEPMLGLARDREEAALGFVVACYSDPGLTALRAQSARPVVGIQEAAVSLALASGRSFGVAAILPASVKRQRRNFLAAGLEQRWAGSRPLGLGVAELADPDRTMARLVEVGRALRDEDGADVVILGCAGMSDYRRDLSRALDLPVIDPTQAAVSIALGRILPDAAP